MRGVTGEENGVWGGRGQDCDAERSQGTPADEERELHDKMVMAVIADCVRNNHSGGSGSDYFCGSEYFRSFTT